MSSLLPIVVFGAASLLSGAVLIGAILPKTALICFLVALGVMLFLLRKLEQTSVARTAPTGPLAGIRVLDMSVVIAGPLACAHLAQLGAQVIKIECLDNLDSARGLGPSVSRGMTATWSVTGFGKQTIILDCKKADGLAVFYALLKQADVVVQNFRPGVVDRIGVGYEDCKKINPSIIYVSSHGYGDKGPCAQQPVYDPIIQCLTGTAFSQRDSAGHPVLVGQAIYDKFTCLSTCQAIVAALVAREKGAGGMHVETSMLAAAMQWAWPTLFRDHVWAKPQLSSANTLLDDAYPCEDKSMPVLSPAQVLQSRAYKSRLRPHTEHLIFGEQRHLEYPARFSAHKLPSIIPCAAMMGEHTTKLLKELGFDANNVIKKGGAISTAALLTLQKNKSAKIFKLLEFLQRCRRPGTGTFDGPRVKGALDGSKVSPDPTAVGFAAGPMAGVRIVELASLFAGPTASSLLGDEGATIIKVERTNALDPLRNVGPFAAPEHSNMGASFVVVNRNKQSLVLDPSLPADCACLVALLRTVDVMVVDDNEKQAWKHVLDTLKIPHLVTCVVDKEQGERAIQAACGLCHTQAGSPVCVPIAELIGGYYAAIAITTALFSRCLGSAGKGETVTVPLSAATLHWGQVDILWNLHYPALDKAPPCLEYHQLMHLVAYKGGGFGFLAPLNDKQWEGFVEGFPELKEEPEYERYVRSGKWKTLPERFQFFEIWLNTMVRVASKCTYEMVEERARNHGIPHQHVLMPAETLAHPQIVANDAIMSIDRTLLNPYSLAASPLRFGISPQMGFRASAPLPDEHRQQVMQFLRLD